MRGVAILSIHAFVTVASVVDYVAESMSVEAVAENATDVVSIEMVIYVGVVFCACMCYIVYFFDWGDFDVLCLLCSCVKFHSLFVRFYISLLVHFFLPEQSRPPLREAHTHSVRQAHRAYSHAAW